MSLKRKYKQTQHEDFESKKKHTLDSDEEDSDDYEKDDRNDVDGEEEGEANIIDEVKITPFNMREELEEGHFDKEGHYHWNKEAQINDNWLDNVDWVKVKTDKRYLDPKSLDNTLEPRDAFNEIATYTQLFQYMEPNETIQMTLQRLGKGRTKISSAERLKRKKLNIVDEASEKITKFTELTNLILTNTGNMDIYQESYSQIRLKIDDSPTTSKSVQGSGPESFDMYADDFVQKERQQIDIRKSNTTEGGVQKPNLIWEFKWKQNDTELNGPHSTEQMLKWSQEKYFKDGVYVRKVGEKTNFYSSNRIDFDLYL